MLVFEVTPLQLSHLSEFGRRLQKGPIGVLPFPMLKYVP